MPWFKVDDNLAFHAKTVKAGNSAMGLWVRAGSWSAQNLTDGHVPDHIARMLGTSAQAAKLVTAGLWKTESGGFLFHEWDERQPKRETIEAERAAARERSRANRARRKTWNNGSSQVSDSGSPELPRTGPDPFGTPDPTRPDPTPTSKEVGGPRKRATQIPDDFRPTDKHIELAAELGVDLRAEWSQFVDHHRAKGSTMKDWNAALRTWIRNAAKFSAGRGKIVQLRPEPDAEGKFLLPPPPKGIFE